MALRVKQAESPTQKKIRELAERTPVVKWIFPSLPEEVRSGEKELDLPTAVGMMGPGPIGLTKLGGARKIVGPTLRYKLSSVNREGLLTSLRAWLKTPKKVQEFIKGINVGTDYPFYDYTSRKIGLPTTVAPDEIVHEIIHAAQDKLLRKRGSSLYKIANLEQAKMKPGGSRITSEFFPDVYTEGFLHNLGYETGTTLDLSTRKLYRELIKNIDMVLHQYKGK